MNEIREPEPLRSTVSENEWPADPWTEPYHPSSVAESAGWQALAGNPLHDVRYEFPEPGTCPACGGSMASILWTGVRLDGDMKFVAESAFGSCGCVLRSDRPELQGKIGSGWLVGPDGAQH